MAQLETSKGLKLQDSVTPGRQWKTIYRIGGCAALLSVCATIADIIVGTIASADLTALPQTAIERFAEFEQNWLLGLYHLDLLNVITTIVTIPTYFALFVLHRKKNLPYAALAMLFSAIGATIFITSNSALPMLELANKYYSVADESQRMLYAAAGEALLASGGHGGLGVFIGFAFTTIAALSMSVVMLHGQIFSRVVSYLGIIGNSLLLLYILLVTFVPALQSMAVAMAAPGGLVALAWILMLGIKLVTAEDLSK